MFDKYIYIYIYRKSPSNTLSNIMAYKDFKAKFAYPLLTYLSVSLSLFERVTSLALSQHICNVFPDNLKRLPSFILYVYLFVVAKNSTRQHAILFS